MSDALPSPTGNILLIDDMPDNLRLLSGLLTEQGYKVRKVLNGKLAIQAAQLSPPDLILLDIMMPEMDGYEVCCRLKSDSTTKDIPIIFLSACDSEVDKIKAFAVGGVDYITKPFYAAEVLARIETQLRLRRLQGQLQQQNSQLEKEIRDRQQFEFALRELNSLLEEKISERTLALEQTNLQLEQEVTERKKVEVQLRESLHQRELLLREVHHRVKNNLQIISSLFSLQSARLEDNRSLAALRTLKSRIRAIALVYEQLKRPESVEQISSAVYIHRLVQELLQTYQINPSQIEVNLSVVAVAMDIDRAIPCGLIVNELVTNALQHAFNESTVGQLHITFDIDSNQATLQINDTGNAPPNHPYPSTKGLGLSLVESLAQQLNGTFHLQTGDRGTAAKVMFPLNEEQE